MAERGRPSLYTNDIADEICARLADGETLRQICRDEHMPSGPTVRLWVINNINGDFSERYARARELGYLEMADELLEITDDGRNDWMLKHGDDDAGWVANGEHIQRSRLRVDTRKWTLAKVLPKIYGDKIDVNAQVDGQLTINVVERAKS